MDQEAAQPPVAIADIVGRDLPPGGETPTSDHLLACLMHITNARPLFALLDLDAGKLVWSSGGAEFGDLLCGDTENGCVSNINTCQKLFSNFGFDSDSVVDMLIRMANLQPGEGTSSPEPVAGTGGRHFRLHNHRRRSPHEHMVQVSVHDVTPFMEAAERTRRMAADLVAKLEAPIEDGDGAMVWLKTVLQDLEQLFALDDDEAIKDLTEAMSERVNRVSDRMVGLLRSIEDQHDESHWQPQDHVVNLRDNIPMHESPVDDWSAIEDQILTCVDGRLGVVGAVAESLQNAYHFVKNAESTFIISPQPGEIYVLNGKHAEKKFSTVAELLRCLDVEVNSMQTALDFFQRLESEASLAQFSLDGSIVHAWGRPGPYGGWQSNMVFEVGERVDVRGMFHGIKNLLLHLQVLYVLKTRNDVDDVRVALAQSAKEITARLDELSAIANTGKRNVELRVERVSDWLVAAEQAGNLGKGKVAMKVADDIQDLSYLVMPHEMQDTLYELVTNAFHHEATAVSLNAYTQEGYLLIDINDNGSGIAPEKLTQIHRVLESGRYDPSLSTREDGTGNGLLSAQAAVRRLVDGALRIGPGKDGVGSRVSLSMKLPTPERAVA